MIETRIFSFKFHGQFIVIWPVDNKSIFWTSDVQISEGAIYALQNGPCCENDKYNKWSYYGHIDCLRPTVQYLCAICFYRRYVQECEQREGGVRMDPCQPINEDTSDYYTDISTTYQ